MKRRVKNRFQGPALAWLFPFLLFLAGPGAGLFPLYGDFPKKVEGPQKSQYWQFWFLLEQNKSQFESEWIVRPIVPLYSDYSNRERDSIYRSVIYPLFYIQGTRSWRRWSVADLFSGDSVYHQDSGEDTDLSIPPFVFWGYGDSPAESYTGIFPFYGTWKDKISWSTMTYVLWPVYMNWTYREYEAHSVLWPILMWGSGANRSDFRLLFVYSQKVHRGKYDRRSVLWPFFQWGREGIDAREPRNYFFFFPFYGKKWSDHGNMKAVTLLWPLFSAGYDTVRESENLRLFWFLYQYESSRDPYIRKHIAFPFYGTYRFGSEDQKYWKSMEFVTPLYLNLKMESSALQANDTYVGIFLYQDLNTTIRTTGIETNHTRLWPLFHSERSTDGTRSLSSLSLWFYRSEMMDHLWAPILSGQLFEYKKRASGDRYFSLLLRSFAIQWNEAQTDLFLAGWEYHEDPKKGWSVELLGGLVGFGRDRKSDASTFELFWFDL